ncbi:MAG: hypothetical protein KAH21_03205 [Spirochaetaceae bacterium]|nr:hypothetical protein [Spirochaetaceae bacterium]
MNTVIKEQIISELEDLPDQKVPSLLDYLHFLKQESLSYRPNSETVKAMKEDKSNFPSYGSAGEFMESLERDT